MIYYCEVTTVFRGLLYKTGAYILRIIWSTAFDLGNIKTKALVIIHVFLYKGPFDKIAPEICIVDYQR